MDPVPASAEMTKWAGMTADSLHPVYVRRKSLFGKIL